MTRLAGLVVAGLICLGCEGKSPLPPIAPQTTPAEAQEEYRLSGRVMDTAWRWLRDARVEVIAGTSTGTVVATDADGRFSMPGLFTGSVTLRASKDGYFATSNSFPSAGPRPPFPITAIEVALYLQPLAPSANIAGEYTLTLTADSACSLPADARSRAYIATISPAFSSTTTFGARLSDARFFSDYNTFVLGVAGDFVSISVGRQSEDPAIVEQLGERTYVAIAGGASGSFTASGITLPFHGYFEYCPAGTALTGNRYSSCSMSAGAQGVLCDSHNHRLTLVRH